MNDWTTRWTPLLENKPALVRDSVTSMAVCLDELRVARPPNAPLDLATELGAALAGVDSRLYCFNILALAACALAESHALGRVVGEPDAGAAALVERILAHADPLPRATRRLLDRVRDGVALDDGRAAFVDAVRRGLRRAGRWRHDLVDIDKKRRPRLAGRLVEYLHDEEQPDGVLVVVRRRFTLENAEGRLFLLLAAGRSVVRPPRSALSRVRRTIEDTTKGAVSLVTRNGTLSFSPPLQLTPRAAMWARRIASVRSKIPPLERRRVRRR